MIKRILQYIFGISSKNQSNNPFYANQNIEPLIAGIVGHNAIVNDGVTSNKIRVRFTNSSTSKTIIIRNSSALTLFFAASYGESPNPEDNPYPWAINSENQIVNFQIEVFDARGNKMNGSMQSELRAKSGNNQGTPLSFIFSDNYSIQARSYVDMVVSDIVTGFPEGPTLVTASCSNLSFDGSGREVSISYPVFPNGFLLWKKTKSN